MNPHEHLIVALDLSDRNHAMALARQLCGRVGMVKIGLEAFAAFGPDFVREIRDLGHEVFLDLKLHDIPNTVAGAARQASRLGVKLLTVHASGGAAMVQAARQAAAPETQIIAVTVLTSLDDAVVKSIGSAFPVRELALRLGALARESGANGLVCSKEELTALSELGGVRVVPGIRPAGAQAADQKRVATPRTAMQAGATWIVVGRPILEASDPAAAAQGIVDEIAQA
jgi:orotidine-5'-phosphate decarboxylase